MPEKAIQYPQLSVSLLHHPRIFLLQQTKAITEIHNMSKCREQLTLGCPSLNDTSTTQPLPIQGTSWKGGPESL